MTFKGIGENQILSSDGTLAAPSIASTNHPDTGLAWDVGGTGAITLSMDGASLMQWNGGAIPFTTTSGRFRVPSGLSGTPGLQIEDFDWGIFRSSTTYFATVLEGAERGWRVGNFGGVGGFLVYDPSGSVMSIASVNDFDTGVNWATGGANTLSVETAGVERTRWGASGEIVDAPALANSTGAVSDTGAVQTTDATQTTLHTLTLADNTTYAVSVTVAGRDTAGTERCSYIRYVQAHRQGGGGATISAITTPFSVESDAGLDCTYTVSGNDLRVSITGKAGTTINWSGSIKYIGSE
jgi:hypothetical protein